MFSFGGDQIDFDLVIEKLEVRKEEMYWLKRMFVCVCFTFFNPQRLKKRSTHLLLHL
jgi:hypothetical protein